MKWREAERTQWLFRTICVHNRRHWNDNIVMFSIVPCDGKRTNGQNALSMCASFLSGKSALTNRLFLSLNSRSCGTGYKERRVECKQIMAQEHTVERRPELCPSQKPQSRKPCNAKPCAPDDQRPPISSSNSSYIQHDPKKSKVDFDFPSYNMEK